MAWVVVAAQDIVGILQQLQNGSSPVLLRHLIAQAGDSPVVGRPVPQLVEKGAYLTPRVLLDDPFARRSTRVLGPSMRTDGTTHYAALSKRMSWV